MRFFQSALLAVSALASMALAQSSTLLFTAVPTSVTVGNSYTIEWKTTDTTSPITITLRKGSSGNLQTISTLTSTATGTTYTWIPDKSLADGSDYALQITQGTQINYSGQITISGGSLSAISSAASASTSASSSASAASVSQSVLSVTSITGNSTAPAKSSVSAASTGKSNSTISTATLSATVKVTSAASAGASGTQTATQGAPTGAAGQLGSSPMALIFGAMAAMVYLN